jgi:molybdopterin/thiamine biosynthesis adenylyltransferase
MDDAQLTRYSRHILLDEVGIDGQQRLLDSRVLLVGAGGLGSPVALYLASAGVGELTVCDGDTVDLTNLQRQVAHATDSIGMPKVESIARTLRAINPSTRVVALAQRLEGRALLERVAAADVVVDASDNFPTRHALNAACVRQRKPLVSGAAIRFDGQVAVFDLRDDRSPCYHCLFPQPDAGTEDEERCATMGVFAPLVGVIGAMQAAEALKLITGVGRSLSGRLLLFNARDCEWREVRVKRDPGCAVCAAG